MGTKSLVARLANRRNTIGIDCVAMSVDDIAAQGAEPLFFLDYISIGKLVPEEIDEIVSGVAEGCRRAKCALLGGVWLGPTRTHEIAQASRELFKAG